MAFYNFLAYGKTDAGSGKLFLGMQALKNNENSIGVL